jgi:hypothetical protein
MTGISRSVLLVLGVGRPEFERLFLQPRALLAGGGSGRAFFPVPTCTSTSGVGEDVAVPAGVLRCAAFRGDDETAIDGFPLEQRQMNLSPDFRPVVVSKNEGTVISGRLGWVILYMRPSAPPLKR